MVSNGGKTKSVVKSFYALFANPVAVFIYSLLFALLSLELIEKDLRPYGIVGVGIVYVMGSVAFAVWNEKISAKKALEDNQNLKRRVSELETEKEALTKEKNALENEVPKAIEYSNVRKYIELKDADGNACFKMSYEGKSLSESPVDKVRHFLTTEQKVMMEKLTNTKFNNEDILPKIEYTECIKNGKTTWRNEIYFETSEPVQIGKPLDTSYDAELGKEYSEAFKGGTSITQHEVSVKTDRFLIEIVAPEGFYFKNPVFDVRDVFSDIEIHHEKSRIRDDCMPIPKQERKKIVWDILYPKLSYRYVLKFSLEKA